ncbi:sugar phosphate isomerase/epimerase family protein [Shouchella lehensis]|uniref:Sugar phosphate isomerase/epimerase n=1 Tax=Shouchella lehensis TaxID=300825 RepID=A0A4Y7WI17_9BACI|nr:TIM barrel protein [Shouchella lehensis]MBG9782620.1 AP endonuclease [Shouchella lehensis]RQW21925.1 sugar phosphate isomerase/epimerase [Bacillus sp. C1-1]TES47765.1 sugar phosphate isomerase/epimerase [Shouchella lehensis]
MKHQFSLAHLTALECAPPELTYLAAQAGYDFVSIRPIYMGLPDEPNYDLATNKVMFKETKIALQQTGLNVHDIELARVHADIDPLIYEPAFEVAAELGAKHVLSSIWTDDTELGREKFAQLCDLARPYGLIINLESVPIASVKTLKGAIHVLEDVKRENVGLMIDAHHFHRADDCIDDLKTIPKEWLHYFHLCDAQREIPVKKEEMTRILREERLYIGEGGLPLKDMVTRLPSDIVFSLEMPHKQRTKELGTFEYIKKCLESAKTFVQEKDTRIIKK